MTSVWSSLVPLILGGALVPIPILITLLSLRSSAGKLAGVGYVLGMTTVRLAQGALFGLVWSRSSSASTGKSGATTWVAVVLLVTGVVLLVSAAKSYLHGADPDAPPPKWLSMIATMGPGKAFGLGAGMLLVQVKFWIFTLGAISVIGAANMGQPSASLTFLVFVVATESVSIAAIVYAYAAPRQSEKLLGNWVHWLEQHNRQILIVVGFVFGVWFSIKGLVGLGVL